MRVVVLITAACAALVAAKSPYQQRQAKRADVVGRLSSPRLRPRTSPAPCSSHTFDKQGTCCTTTTLDKNTECCNSAVLDKNQECCSTATLDKNQACCSTKKLDKDKNCCPTGATNDQNSCCPASQTYQMCDGPACCHGTATSYPSVIGDVADECCSGTVYQDSDTSNACCEKSLLPGGSSPYKVCCDASKIAGAGTTASPYVCCTTSTFTDTNGVKQCCPIGTTPAASVAGGAKDKCCQNGALYYPDGTSNSATCCSSGNLVPNIGDGSLPTICCKSTQIAVGGACVGPNSRMAKRAAAAVPQIHDKRFVHEERDLTAGSSMAWREGSPRTVLSAQLVADHLSNGGFFYHNGKRHVDVHHARTHTSLFQKALDHGLDSVAKYSALAVTKVAGPKVFSQEYLALSPKYEFATADVPEIYARVMANASFQGFFHTGRYFDRSLVHDLASYHPDFDATLVERYRK